MQSGAPRGRGRARGRARGQAQGEEGPAPGSVSGSASESQVVLYSLEVSGVVISCNCFSGSLMLLRSLTSFRMIVINI